MSEKVAREFRRHSGQKIAFAALQNEGLTRARVENLELCVEKLAEFTGKTELLAQDLANWRSQPLMGRLRWLFTGR